MNATITTPVGAIASRYPWLPADYLRLLPRLRPGQACYGLTWFDAPKRPAEVSGPAVAAAFPDAVWIGRRHGQMVGYEAVESGQPALCEWGGSQRQVTRRFAGIDELILSQRDPASDMRPVVQYDFPVPGIAFCPWHDAHVSLVADCILSHGRESEGLRHLLGRRSDDWQITLLRSDGDSWLSARRHGAAIELLVAHHGSVGDWHAVDGDRAFGELLALAPYNDGSQLHHFASMEVRRATPAVES